MLVAAKKARGRRAKDATKPAPHKVRHQWPAAGGVMAHSGVTAVSGVTAETSVTALSGVTAMSGVIAETDVTAASGVTALSGVTAETAVSQIFFFSFDKLCDNKINFVILFKVFNLCQQSLNKITNSLEYQVLMKYFFIFRVFTIKTITPALIAHYIEKVAFLYHNLYN